MAEETKILHKGWLTTREGEKYAPATLIENVFSRNGTPYDTEIKQYVQQVKGESTETLTKVQNQLNTLEEELDVTVEQLNNKDSELEDKLANFEDDQSDALYIIDKNNNVIAYVDENGVTSTNFNVPGTTTLKAAAADITTLQTRMQTAETDIDDLEYSMRNIGVEDDNSLYIIDSQDNVIAYIDASGVHSTNFIIDNNNSDYANYLSLLAKVEAHITEIQNLKTQDGNLQTQIQTLSDSINERLKNFNGEDDEIFFFIDSQDNVIAYIDAEGIHTTGLDVTEAGINVDARLNIHDDAGNVLAYIDTAGVHASDVLLEGSSIESLKTILHNLEQTDSGLATQISEVRQSLNDEISTRSVEDGKLQATIDKIDQRTKYINGEANDSFYIIDKDENVLAYVDEKGLHTTEVFTEVLDDDTLKQRYTINTIGGDVDALKTWRPSIQEQADNNTNDVTRIFGMMGEDRDFDITVGADHKSRLNKVDDVLDLDSTDANGKSNRLDRLDALVGDDSVENGGGADTHETRLRELRTDLTAEAEARLSADTVFEERTTALETKTQYFDGAADKRFYITDNNGNVIAYFDEQGLTVTDLKTQGIKLTDDNTYTLAGENEDLSTLTPVSLNRQLVDLQNRMKNKTERLIDIENRLNSVSNVMDFIGAFETYEDLTAYETPNNGDVAIVINTATEYVYDGEEKTWVELGHSTEIATAIANLQSTVGSTDGLNADEKSHKERLTSLENAVGINNNPLATSHESRLIVLEQWKPSAQDEIDCNESDITRIYGMLGENRNADITPGHEHKTRLEKIDDILGLNSTEAEGASTRLDRLDEVVGYVNPDNTEAGTHETRLVALRSDLAGEISRSSTADQEHDEQIKVLQEKTEYLDTSTNNKFFIIDSNDNVLAYFDEQGLVTTNVIANGIIYNPTSKKYEATGHTADSAYSLNERIANILNDILDINARNAEEDGRLDSLENRVDIQETVTGETVIPTDQNYRNHKTRLDDLEESLTLDLNNSDEIDGRYIRLDRLDTLVGLVSDEANQTGTHEAQLKYLHNEIFTEKERSSQKDQEHDEDITNIYDILGEEVYVDGEDHKKRLDKLYTILNLDYTDESGVSHRLNRLDDLVGYVDEEHTEAGTHETRLLALRSDLTAEVSRSSQEDTKHAEAIKVLQDKTEYLDASEAKKFFIIDSNDNVLAYFDERGLITTNVIANGIIYDSENNEYKATGYVENSEYSLNERIVAILNNIIDIEAIDAEQDKRLSDLETRMAIQEAVTGEIEEPTDENYRNHKTRLDELENSLHLNLDEGDSIDGRYERLDRLDNLVGKVGDSKSATGSHEARLLQLDSDLDAEVSRSSDKDQEHDENIELIFDILGETTHTDGEEHKTRLDKLYDVLTLDSTSVTGESARLKRLDDLVGTADDAAADTGTHEARIKGLRTDLTAEQQRNNTHDTDIDALQKKTTNLDASGDDTTFFIVDNQNNVLAYFDSSGINVIDLYGHGITQDVQTGKYVVANGRGQYSLNTKLKDILNDIIDLRGVDATTDTRLDSIEDRLANVSNVMDFIGAFATKNDLDKYATDGKAHNGDVAVVIENNTEYVYCIDDDPQLTGWVEMGYSTATQTAISNLQNVVGRTDALATGEASHEARLDAVEPIVNDHATRLGQVETSLGMDDNGISTRLQTIDELIGRKENDASANTHEGRIKFIEGRLSPVSNIMDFIGSFATKTALDAYTPCHHGDFAWVTGTNTEYIYDTNKWVEVGRSDQTVGEINGLRSDLANLQGVVGDTDIPSGALSHEQRIGTIEDKFEDLEVIFDWVKDDTLYIIDKNNNTLAYFDQNGLTVTDVHLLKSNGQTTSKATMMFFEETGTYSF